MISGEKISELVKDPQSVSKDQISDIQNLIEKFPYCSSLYVIELLGLSKYNDIQFEGRLKIAASHVSDREHLHNLIHDIDSATPAEVEEEVLDEQIEEIIEENEEVLVEDTLTENIEEDEEESVEDHIDEMIEEVVEEVLDEEEEEVEEEVEEEDEEVEVEDEIEEEVELADLEESIMSSVVESAFAMTEEESDTSTPLSVTDEEKKEVVEIPIERPKNMTFIEWLKYKQSIIDQTGKKTKPIVEEIKDAKSMSKKEINELLDKFIEEKPSIKGQKTDFYDPTSNAKKSLEDSTDIVSETLAKIHVMQGNYKKALTAYKQLSLLYPEKKAYFASQIKKIKETQNS